MQKNRTLAVKKTAQLKCLYGFFSSFFQHHALSACSSGGALRSFVIGIEAMMERDKDSASDSHELPVIVRLFMLRVMNTVLDWRLLRRNNLSTEKLTSSAMSAAQSAWTSSKQARTF